MFSPLHNIPQLERGERESNIEMADAAVEFLLENLKQLLVHHAHLLKGAKDQVEKLENHLRLFKAFLKDAPKQWREDDTLRELIRRIRNAVYEAEDIIDAYVTQAAEAKNRNYFLRAIHGPPKIVSIAEKVEAVLKKIDDIYTDKSRILDFANIKVEDGGPDDNEVIFYFFLKFILFSLLLGIS